jgi:hypothetical protein
VAGGLGPPTIPRQPLHVQVTLPASAEPVSYNDGCSLENHE